MRIISHSIIFSGKISSGKSSISKLVAERLQVPRVSFGDYLQSYCESNNIPTTRKSLQDTGKSLIENDPELFLANVIDLADNSDNCLLFDGVRHVEILDLIKRTSKRTTLVFVDSDDKTRKDRFIKRYKSIDKDGTPESFKIIENHSVEGEISKIKLSSDLIVNSKENINKIANKILNYLQYKDNVDI